MEVYRRLWPYLWRYRGGLAAGVICVICQIAVQVKIPVYIGQAFDLLETSHATAAADPARIPRLLEALHHHAWLIFGLSSVSVVFLFFKRWLVVSASRHIEYDFRGDFFDRILRLSMSYFDRHKTGDIMARATNDLESVRQVIGPGILYPINAVTMVVAAYTQMIPLSPVLAFLTVLPALALFAIMRFFGKRLFRHSKKAQDQFGEINSLVQENLSGMRTIRAYGREASEEARFDAESRAYIKHNLNLARYRAAFFPSLLIVVFWGMTLLLGAGAWMVRAELITLGELIAFFGILQMMIWPIVALGWIVSVIQRGAAAMERMTDVLDFASDTPDRPEPQTPPNGMAGRIEYHDLTFRYPGAETPALSGIELALPPGGVLGIIGPTGSGKTTLAGMLARFYPVADGALSVDGVDLNDWPAATLRRGIGIVTQESFLFSDTVANNIGFAAPEEVDRERAERCARVAQLEAEIDELPDGYDALLGERGINFSGGQKQRTAIARALYRDPRILILDDALSAVDTETESRILEGLRETLAGRTVLLISHRVSTVRLADEIVFLDEGRIIERGTHDELLAAGGRYAELHRKQELASEIELMNDIGD